MKSYALVLLSFLRSPISMTSLFRLSCHALPIAQMILANPVLATCGGGGGGGAGGVAPRRIEGGAEAGPSAPEIYHVPWKFVGPGAHLPRERVSMLVLWFPVSAATVRDSELLTSRGLTLASARCVVDVLVSSDNRVVRESFQVPPGIESIVFANPDGSVITRVAASPKGKLELRAVEKALVQELDSRETALKESLDAAEKLAKKGDTTAITALQKVWAERCLFPTLGKRAAKALQKLGVKVAAADLPPLGGDDLADPDVRGAHAGVESVLRAGLEAEIAADYPEAERLYRAAVEMDAADTTALRFLGEFYRHNTGRWDLAGRAFRRVLAQPADPVAQAVALHGLGKMTIHSGKFAEGLALFDQSLQAFELPITYRNLAVYWFSEKQTKRAAGFMRQALALAPDDRYNQIFAAVYLAAAGQTDEALQIAQQNENLLEASYNLAAIWAQAGDTARALKLLERHFYAYERYEPIRAMEMKEAREDMMFASLHAEPAFEQLTKGAKNAWMIGAEFCTPEQLLPVTAAPGPRKM